jgi:hypothetical protein
LINQNFWYDLGTVPLNVIDASNIDSNIECGNILNSFQTSCILRTVNKIPTPMYTVDGVALPYVGTVDLQNAFIQSSVTKILQAQYYKYTKYKTRYFLLNNYNYIVSPPTDNLTYIRITGIWQNPLDAY